MAVHEGVMPAPAGRAMGRLVGLELFKLRRRPMTTILLAILLGISAFIPVLFYVALRATSASSGQVGDADRAVLLDRIVFPGVLHGAVENVVSFGVPLLIVLAATSFGGEFAWGTVRLLLARGEGRGEYVLSKLAAIAVWWGVAVLGGTAIGLAAGAFLGTFDDPPSVVALSGGEAAGLAGRLLGAWLAALVYVALTAAVTTHLRSTAFGLAAGLVSFYGEGVAGGVADSLDIGWLEWFLRMGINYNMQAAIGGEGVENPPLFALALLAVHSFVLLGIAIRHLRAKDVITSGAG